MTIHASGANWKPFVRSVALEVDAKFPRADWTSTYPGHGENSPIGAYAIDFMCSKSKGDAIVAYLIKHRKRLAIRYIIWYRRWINWGTDGENAKWKPYFDGYATNANGTANPSRQHTNHVHVSCEPDGRYIPLAKPVTMYAAEEVKGYSFEGKVKYVRPKGRALTGVIQEGAGGEKYLVTAFGTWYPLARLSKTKPAAPKPPEKPPVVPPKPSEPTPVLKPPATAPAADDTQEATVPTNPPDAVTNGLPLTPLPAPLKERLRLDAPGAGNWQGALEDPSTGDWIIAEAVKRAGTTDGTEDCLFHRFNSKGVYIDSMTAKVAPGVSIHPTGWGVDDSSNIFCSWAGGAPGTGSALVKFPYQGGATVEYADVTRVAPSLVGTVQVALSPSRTYAVVRRIRAATTGFPNGSDQFTRYKTADLLANTPIAVGKMVEVPRSAGRVMQGFTLEEDLLFCLTGFKDTTKVLEKYSLTTGLPLVNYDLTPIPGEPEGLDWNTIGMKTGSGDTRFLALMYHNL